MSRRYIRRHSRPDQPDPYDGSYSLTDPQSFNRYAYVQGDPVNLVDPSGLKPGDACVKGDTVGVEGNDGRCDETPRGHVDVDPPTDTSPMDDPTMYNFVLNSAFLGLGLGQGPGRAEKEISDCQTFAALVDTIANDSSSRREFLDNIARTFTSADNSGIREMRDNGQGPLVPPRRSFGDSGFKSQFKDGGNQARHFVGGFIAAANLGWLAAKTLMNDRETPGVDDADIALNGVSTQLGANTIGRGIGYIRKNAANDIRTQVCE